MEFFKRPHLSGRLFVSAYISKGERGTPIVFYKKVGAGAEGEEDHEEPSGLRFIARASWVVNEAQMQGWDRSELAVRDPVQILAGVEAFVANAPHGEGAELGRLRAKHHTVLATVTH